MGLSPVLIYALTFTLAACSLLYELAIAQAVSLFALNNVVWYSLSVGVFIGAMGLGALLAVKWFPSKNMGERLLMLEAMLSLAGGMSVLAVHAAYLPFVFDHAALEAGVGLYVVFLGTAFVCMLVVGILSGMEIPLLMDILEARITLSGTAARILAMDYLGALAAGLLFPLVLLPSLGVLKASWVVALVNALAALVIFYCWKPQLAKRQVMAPVLLVVLFAGLVFSGNAIEALLARAYYGLSDTALSVDRTRTPYQTIDLVPLDDGGDPLFLQMIRAYSQKVPVRPDGRGFGLFLNGDFQFASDFEEVYHEAFAHIPVIASGRVPQRVLLFGAGDGLLARELLKYPGVKEIVLVDIDPQVVAMFKTREPLRALNKDALWDPRVKVVFDDAYHFARTCRERFDAVFLDLPEVTDFNLSRVYSREFYTFVRQCLKPDGFMVMDAPGISERPTLEAEEKFMDLYDGSAWRVLNTTLRAAGFISVVPYVSRLEAKNPEAQQVFGSMYEDVEAATREVVHRQSGKKSQIRIEGHEAVVREMILDHVDRMAAGFIMASGHADWPGHRVYADPGVPLQVLTPLRFHLTMQSTQGFSDDMSGGGINSIFRPLLPSVTSWRKVRSAY